MSKHERVAITMEDALDYAQALGHMYGLVITVELKPVIMGGVDRWSVNAHAWSPNPEAPSTSVAMYAAHYPSSQYKSFPGCVLGACMRLEMQLQGWYWLSRMGSEPEA